LATGCYLQAEIKVEGVMIERQGILEQVQSDIQQATSELENSIYGRQLKEYQSQI